LDGGFAAASAARLSARAFVWTIERWRERERRGAQPVRHERQQGARGRAEPVGKHGT
jgi:hypothetical protein